MENKRVFQLIDLDRTLFDTSRFAKLITNEVNKIHPGLGTQLDTRFEEAYKNEETFFLLRYLRHEMGDEPFEQLVMDIVEREGKDSLLLPGAKERLRLADEYSLDGPSWAILTFGDEIDQRMKLRIIGLQDAPLILSETPDKGFLIRQWQNEDGTFTLPLHREAEAVEMLTLEDDKLRAFNDIPANVYGIWVTPRADAKVILNDQKPERVTHVADLFESIDYLQNLIFS